MGAYETAPAAHRKLVDELLADTAANGGLAPIDIEQFWADQEIARKDPFGADIPQVPLGAVCNWECIFEELGEPQDWWRFQYEDEAWALDLSRRYNDLAEEIVGKRLISETPKDPTRLRPGPRETWTQLHNGRLHQQRQPSVGNAPADGGDSAVWAVLEPLIQKLFDSGRLAGHSTWR
jgi:hypothetical protein